VVAVALSLHQSSADPLFFVGCPLCLATCPPFHSCPFTALGFAKILPRPGTHGFGDVMTLSVIEWSAVVFMGMLLGHFIKPCNPANEPSLLLAALPLQNIRVGPDLS